ncbi:MAG TPA: type II asparaginase, partial [Polyangiales bacterium]
MKGMTTGPTLIIASWLSMLVMTPRSPTKLAHVALLATGGIIAGVPREGRRSSSVAGHFAVEDMLRALPQLRDVANLSGEQVVDVESQTMSDAVWIKLGKRVNEVLREGKADGVVITHGTDTLEETAYFLSLIAKSDKPIVMTGSVRPATAIGADGPANLYNAVALAASSEAKGRGVLVTLNDEVHFAREVEKANSTQLDTFQSPNRGRAGIINAGRPKLWSHLEANYGLHSEFSVEGLDALPRVEIVYSYASAKRDLVDALVDKGVRGIVLAGVGDGNTTDELLAGLRDAARKGVVVVRSSRTGSGVVARNVEVSDDELGFVASEELNPAKSRVLLMLALTKSKDLATIQSFFERY